MEDKFAERLIKDLERLKYAIKYYAQRNIELENEVKYLQNAYENRVNEYLKDVED